jgi:hypothetical protein
MWGLDSDEDTCASRRKRAQAPLSRALWDVSSITLTATRPPGPSAS